MNAPAGVAGPVGTDPGADLQRLALARYAVLETPADPAFDDLAEVARLVTGAAAGGIGFVDGHRLWIKAARGFRAQECDRGLLPRRTGAEAPGRGLTDVVTAESPITLGDSTFDFWAGAPLTTSEGYHLGELFVLDDRPRDLFESERSALSMLARQVVARLEQRRTVQSYHAVVDGVGHVVFQLDDDLRLVSTTPTWSRMTGFGVVRSMGRPLAEFLKEEDRHEVRDRLLAQDVTGGATTFECRLLHLMGGDLPVEVICRPLVDEGGGRRGFVGVIADLTERKAREVEARHAQKLEALGSLSAGLAHEINTPIQFLADNTRFASDAFTSLSELLSVYRRVLAGAVAGGTVTEEMRHAVERAEQEADVEFLVTEVPIAIDQNLDGLARVATLVSAMRTFSDAGQGQRAADLHEALTATVTVASGLVSEVADVRCEFGELPPVVCWLADLNQVFLNLLINAADAIADTGRRGEVTIRTRLDGAHAVVEFTDTGCGMSPELQQRIFEPFFTTKEVGRGTGQGLALAHSVVREKHGGTIDVRSTVGGGTTFTVTIPTTGRPR